MKRCVCAVFDSAAMVFGSPIFTASPGVAMRSFSDEVNRASPDNALNQHPEDFVLHWLAEYDDATVVFNQPEGGMRVLARGKDVKNG